MRPIDLWPAKTRIIEVGATTSILGERLIAAGYCNYLAVVRDHSRAERIARDRPQIRPHVVASLPTNTISQNNADVLVLAGSAALGLSRIRWIRHAPFVAVSLAFTPLCCIGILFAALQCLLNRLALPSIVNCGRHGDGPWLLVFRVRRPRPHKGVRRYIPHRLGIAGFVHHLQSSKVRHAVLRWFEALPQLPPGEDLDLMVDDGALEAVRATLDEGPGIQPIDVYSVTGLPGADFRSMPYFPPHLSEELLVRSIDQHGLCRVPAPREHFLSLAYHALYHKGLQSGIPITGATGSAVKADRIEHRQSQRHPRCAQEDHDYSAILGRLATGLGINVSITLEGLDAFLDEQGWRPPHDMLIRLSKYNRWLRALLRQPATSAASADDRLAVFLVREEALRRGGVERAAQLIERNGFNILTTRVFDERRSVTLARSLRGGNWGRGPWPISGGPPVAAIVAFDPAPVAPTRRDKKRFPFIANARLLCKEQLREAFNDGFAKDQHCNVIHSSDNGREAMDYLRIIMPDDIDSVLVRAQSSPAARAA
jgi:hypothetical protein